MYVADVLALEDEENPDIIETGKTYTFWHPSADYRHFANTVSGSAEALLKKKIDSGQITEKITAYSSGASLEEVRAHVQKSLESLDPSYKRLLNPHIYKVSVSERLRALKLSLINKHLNLTM